MVEVGDGAEAYNALLKEGVIVRPVTGYGFPAHVRISIGTSDENRRLVETLAKVLEK
jgi:histidinol-phosphate aminotransferase